MQQAMGVIIYPVLEYEQYSLHPEFLYVLYLGSIPWVYHIAFPALRVIVPHL